MITYYLNRTKGTMYVSKVAIYGNCYFVGNFKSDLDAYNHLATIYESLCNTNDELMESLKDKGQYKAEFEDWTATRKLKNLPQLVSNQININYQLEFQFRQRTL